MESIIDFLWNPFTQFQIPAREAAGDVINAFIGIFRDFFRGYLSPPISAVMRLIQSALSAIPPLILLLAIFLAGYRASGWKLGAFAVISLGLIGAAGLWSQLIVTLSLVGTALVFCVAIGLPLGILAARYELFYSALRPVLDIMQTTPPFVYLVPAVMLFGIGDVPGLFATIIFAMPPMIRLTALGIRNVDSRLVEAAVAFGSSSSQILWRVQIPLAISTIMTGVNQTIMMALSMVVVAAIIGAGGLGLEVYAGLERLNIGQAFVGGVGIVLVAMVLDRLTQAFGKTVRYKYY